MQIVSREDALLFIHDFKKDLNGNKVATYPYRDIRSIEFIYPAKKRWESPGYFLLVFLSLFLGAYALGGPGQKVKIKITMKNGEIILEEKELSGLQYAKKIETQVLHSLAAVNKVSDK
jgi:hypothetical protein